MRIFFSALAMLGFVAFGIAQVAIGYMGIADGLGKWWAIGALLLAFALRFPLPLTIGAFFGATNVLGWHWLWALLLTLPGLVFMVPGLVVFGFNALRSR